jgi:voltage-gated potassium channel
MPSSFAHFRRGLLVFAITVLISTCGYMLAGWSAMDSLYMVIITVFGVGFGEVHPMDSTGLRVFTMFVVIAGVSAEVYTIGGLIQMLTGGEIRRLMGVRRMKSDIEKLSDHVIVCGFGRIGQVLAEELFEENHRFVIVDSSPERISMAISKGYLVVEGNATEERALIDAGIDKAQVLATVLPDDALNVFITLTARNLNQELTIIARGELPTTHKKLLQAGASQVVLPTMIGAQRIASLIRRPVLDDVLHDAMGRQRLDEDLSRLGVRLQELPIPEDSDIIGKSIGEIELRGEGASLIVGIRHREGHTLSNPSSDILLFAGDTLLILGHTERLPDFIAKAVGSRAQRYKGAIR